jgi:DNA-binding GntR family transcriptional regulator
MRHEGVEQVVVQRFLTKADTVAEWLRTEILFGGLKAGTRLQQEDIAARLGVSSTPVREAFGTLEAEGLLEREAHRGVVVARRDADAMDELTEVRALIEVLAIRRASKAGAAVDFAEMEKALAEASACVQSGDVPGFRVASLRFHIAVVRASGSAPLRDLMNVITSRPILNAPLDAKAMARGHKTHAQILAAMRQHDVERAVELISRHDHWLEDAAATANPKRIRTRRAR